MSKHYLCAGSCGAVVSEEEYNNGLKMCSALQGCSLKGQLFIECEHCDRCDSHTVKGQGHTCRHEKK